MFASPSDFYNYYCPSQCDLRIYLQQKGEPEAKPSPFHEVIRKIGLNHEKTHLASFPDCIDLGKKTGQVRLERTLEEIQKRTPVIYHPLFKSSMEILGRNIDVIGEPDFLVLDGDNYLIRDAKLSRRITERSHPEILRQLELYGWLYEQVVGSPCSGLQVFNGVGEIVGIPYTDIGAAGPLLEEMIRIKIMESEPYSPVGWSKCSGCGFKERCWPQAANRNDVAIVVGVDQGLARALRSSGVDTVKDLLNSFDVERLAEFKKPHGKQMHKVGKKASSILTMARSLNTQQEIMIEVPDIPESSNYVMFDLEGLPPQMDELEKTYLWGFQVFGEKIDEFKCGLAGFGPDGDRGGWEQFLKEAEKIFDEYGDIPWVHWHHYERVKIDMYIKRYGDPGGIAQKVRENLLDLLPITNKSIALPLPSYSLKVIEKYIGFQRTQDEYGGDWAMAKYIEAVETNDEEKRNSVMEEIILYNKEDLEATWAVLEWLKTKN